LQAYLLAGLPAQTGGSADARARSRVGVAALSANVWRPPVKVRLLGFGAIEVDGRDYEHDIVIDGGRVRQRKKKPSKPYRDGFGHTPLSAEEELPWGGSRLIIGTGAYGSLPIMAEVMEEAGRRGVDLVALPTEDACRLIASLDGREVYAVLHVTC
jgi:hypothetical protein